MLLPPLGEKFVERLIGGAALAAFMWGSLAFAAKPIEFKIQWKDEVRLSERFLSFAIDTAQLIGGKWWKTGENSFKKGRAETQVPPRQRSKRVFLYPWQRTPHFA
jgi:hypothetical protein